jgi:nucleoside-diphosphate-sugar epimerase
VLGPDVIGAKDFVPGPIATLLRRLAGLVGRVPMPVITPPVPIQFIHEDDVGQAFLLCIVGARPPGVYNITGDGVLSGAQIMREFGAEAKQELGWRPRYSSLEALRATLHSPSSHHGGPEPILATQLGAS